ncbi:protein translocase subunit SecDF [Porphyromonas levii]|uniref:Multifunctional fusion protein n=1 Tax=Porphyromonas levii TaxID=28114 RepID=A0A4Y8WPX5_9PORP|nr:protein translocase subunit SecDF [Porphyromonas levii]MBR8729148.1 Protein translocase subunit SecD [Porphyromonas levii]MBR8760151.1 Protein translocase subunit SecD [Porphyromonas levii]MBR8766009.1 Protein translocase subunit SecD [Porphyromonas levii]MBR8784049.1 Protein translocase subunit SecD [Porphyromonas levii]MBR8802416.1 Protein translocase subunit SecD [Porphyromonas levii]
MQNKGLVQWTAIILAIVCGYYLSFSLVSGYYQNKAKNYAQGDVNKEIRYLDSLSMKKVWLGSTLQEVREKELGLGLDLKGGMTVILELNAADVLETLSGNSQDPTFRAALESAIAQQERSQKDFITLFVDEFHATDPGARLSAIFGTLALKDKITTSSSDADVEQVLRSELATAIESSHKVLRNRIDRFGVVAPNIQKLEGGHRILVELPGVKEPERVRKLLQGSANLEFWECYMLPEIWADLQRADQVIAQMSSTVETVAEAAPVVVADSIATDSVATDSVATATDDLTALVGEATPSAETTTASNGAVQSLFSLLAPNTYEGQLAATPVVGMAHASDMDKIDSLLNLPRVKEVLPRNLQLKWGVKEMQEGSKIYQLFAIKTTRRDGMPVLGGEVVTNAKSDIDNTLGRQEPVVSMTMNSEGAREWARITKENIGRPIAIVLDDVVYSAPSVNTEIPNGQSQITGKFTVQEADDLANTLNSGKMAASVRIVQEDVVGPSLGQEAISAGLVSFVIALVLLMIYMIMMYGLLPGLVVDAALVVNFFFTIGILASLHAVLTLAGIAGMVLTLGMAVDANVLIFERIKEELAQGKSMIKAIEDGYGNAFSAIIDSNVTTILTGIILYYFGSGPIRGFATTLIVGLVCSFLTAVFLTRIFFERRALKGKMDNITFTTSVSKNFLVDPSVKFIEKSKGGLSIAAAILVAGAIALGVWGLNSGIDFTGGRNYVVKFDQPVSTSEVASLVGSKLDGQVNVITISTAEQVRISTNYKIETNTPEVDAEVENLIYEGVKPLLGDGVSFDQFTNDYIQSSQKVGASMADDIKTGAVIAVVLSLIVMALYILIRFRDVAFSIGAFASVTFTTLSIIALYALLWKVMPFSMEVDQTFIAAVLAIIGYAMNDTIVVFDRIRENLKLFPNRNRKELFNYALNSTLARTFNTSISTLLVVLIIFFFGGASIRSFTFAMILGIVFGTYSTLFVATPIAYFINNKKFNKTHK